MQTPLPSVTQPSSKYRILGKLGEGGMAEVFVGVMDQAPGFRKLLVLKLLRSWLAERGDGLTMFLDEARLAARLNHRNVVQTYDVTQVGDQHAIVMEFLEGASLGKLRRLSGAQPRQPVLPLAECLYIVCEALSGLHYAHELKDFDGSALHFVHRDFTPANVMVTLDGQVKVLDFGVAKTRANVNRTHVGTIKGTARYLAREAVLGRELDRRSDVYMAGAVLWQLVTGARPWDDKEDVAVLASILEKRLAPVRQLVPALPAELEAIIHRATEPEPSARHQSAQELRDALLAFARKKGLASDPDQLAALVRRLAGAECGALRARIDDQLSEPTPTPELMLAATVLVPSYPGVEESASRIRSTTLRERTWSRVRGRPYLFAIAGLMVLGAGLVALVTPRSEKAAPRSTDIHLTVELPAAAQDTSPAGATAHGELSAPELPVRAAEPTRATLALHLEAEPREATLFVDGVRLPSNPAELTLQRDEREHALRAEAPGFVASERVVRFADDQSVTLRLEPQRSARPVRRRHRGNEGKVTRALAPARPVAGRAPVQAEPARAREVTPSAPAARSIDTESPWRR